MKAQNAQNSQRQSDLLVLESLFTYHDELVWIFNFGSKNHVSSSLQMLSSYEKLENDASKIRIWDVSLVAARVLGIAHVDFSCRKFLTLSNCSFILDFSRNLIFVSCLIRDNFNILFDNSKVLISLHGINVSTSYLENGLYVINQLVIHYSVLKCSRH